MPYGNANALNEGGYGNLADSAQKIVVMATSLKRSENEDQKGRLQSFFLQLLKIW